LITRISETVKSSFPGYYSKKRIKERGNPPKLRKNKNVFLMSYID
jgi:hypothetical protein